ncbi:MAG TPA: pitrilysin family protein [Myxococcaceae bacterium]|jgi:zinc protease
MSPVQKTMMAAALSLAAACATATPAPPAPAPATPAPAPKPAPPPRVPVKGEEAISRQPALPPLKEFAAPVPKLVTLKNGLKLYVVERKGNGITAVRFLVKRGASADPEQKPGLASMTAAMMEAGSAKKSEADIAGAADALGAALGVEAGEDALTVGISGMNDKLPQMVKLLADVALKPNMDPAEWKRLQAQRVAELAAARAQIRNGASLAFKAAAYGVHPLARPVEGTPESVQSMTLAEVKAFFSTFGPDQAVLVVVGGASEGDMVKRLTDAFSGWKRSGPPPAPPSSATVPPERPRLVLVDYPQKPQAVLMVGQPSAPRSSPDYIPLTLLNSVLGGSFTSRLNQNLREQHGYTYGAFSRFSFGAAPGPFIAYAQVKTEVTAPALKEMLHELERTVDEPLTADELSKGRALLAYELVQLLEHADSAAGAMGALWVYDLPLDEYRTFVNRLKSLTAQDVQAAAQRALQPGKMVVVVAGDRKAVEPQLPREPALKLPAPQLRDAGGKLVPAAPPGGKG